MSKVVFKKQNGKYICKIGETILYTSTEERHDWNMWDNVFKHAENAEHATNSNLIKWHEFKQILDSVKNIYDKKYDNQTTWINNKPNKDKYGF